MIPFLTEPSAAPGALSGAGGLAAPSPATSPAGEPPRDGSAGLDFAGLLNAALPVAGAAGVPAAGPAAGPAGGPAAMTVLPGQTAQTPDGPALPFVSVVDLRQTATYLPGGTILPNSGAPLPDVAALADSAGTAAQPAPEPLDAAARAALPAVVGPPVPPEPDATTEPAAASDAEGQDTDEAAAAPASDSPASDSPAADSPAAAAPAPIAPAIALTAALAATAPATLPGAAFTPARAAPRVAAQPGTPPLAVENAALPDRAALLTEPADPSAAAPQLTDPTAPAPATQAAPTPASTPAAAPQASNPVPNPAPSPGADPIMAERAEPRAPAPNQASTIAAVGEIREALRAVRPEMTLRHADFGFVSVRLEPIITGQQDWRAVLASRDPGFVPAIQAALAERAVAATSDTAGTGTNTGTNQGQNGTSDHRYGSSPNSGQGSYQPYLGQSSGRDEDGSASRNGRQPSTTDAVANRAGEADAKQADPRERGVFA